MNIQEQVGITLRYLRKKHNLNTLKLAELLFLDESTVKKYESGKRAISITTLCKVLEILNAEIELNGKSILSKKPKEDPFQTTYWEGMNFGRR